MSASHAYATTLQTFNTSTQTANIATTLTDFSKGLTFSSFNTSLGELTSVTLEVSDAFTTTLQVDAAAATAGTVDTEMYVGITDPNSALTGTALQFDSNNDVIGSLLDTLSAKQSFNLAANGTTSIGPVSNSAGTDDTGPLTFTSAAVLSEFSTGANITLTGTTNTTTNISYHSGNANASQTTDASIAATLFYTYIPTSELPEPFSLAIVGSGLVAFGFLRRRFR